MRTLLVRALLPLCVCAGLAVHATAAGADPVVTVSELRWSGVESFDTDDLEAGILTTPESWRFWRETRPFEPGELDGDLDRIAAFYRVRGFYETRVRHALDWSSDRSKVCVHFDVDEGEPVLLVSREITIGDHPALPDEVRAGLVADLPLEEGRIFGVDGYREARMLLLARLLEHGFPAARIRGGADVDIDQRAARVAWQVEPGSQVRFGAVELTGLDNVSADLVRREIDFAEGDLYSRKALTESQRRILGLGLFRTVRLTPIRPDLPPGPGTQEPVAEPPVEAVWPVAVQVEERPPRSVRAGVGFGTEDAVRVQLGWRHRNLFGAAQSLDVEARYSLLLASLDIRYLEPRWRHPDAELELGASALRETTPAYDADVIGVGAMARRTFGPRWIGRLGWSFELVDSTDPSGDFDEIPDSSRLSFFELGLRRNTMNDRLDPRRGTWLDLAIEPSFEAIGSDLDYIRIVVEGRAYHPLGPTVLAARARLGTLEPWGGNDRDHVPVVKRFFSGGSTSVRGFGFQRLGPLDNDDDPLGGLTLAEASLELRFPIWKQLGGVVFGDVGQIASEPSRLRGSEFFYSTGVGARLATPLGPLRLDVATPLNPPDGEADLRVHFSVGQAF